MLEKNLADDDEGVPMSDDIEAVLRLANLPRPVGEQHEMDPPHHLCLGDDPCICIHLAACEQRALRHAIAAIEEQQQLWAAEQLWAADTLVRLGMGTAKDAVNKLMREQA